MIYITFLKSTILRLFFPVVIVLLFYPMGGQSAVFNVTDEDELRDALSMAESNGEDDVINIAEGLYHTGGATFTYESIEDFSLTIQGAGAGLAVLDGDEINRVLEIHAESAADVFVHISGLTIRNGFHISIPGDMSNPNGAGILAVSQNITIQDCEFIDNIISRAGDGGGLHASAQNITLTGNLFNGNLAAFSGGGAYISGDELAVNENEFNENTSGRNGGGAYIVADEFINMSDNILTDNSTLFESDLGGGGIGITNTHDRSTAILTNNVLDSNHSAGNGGGLGFKSRNGFSDNAITLTNNTYTLNTADENGGGVSIIALQPEVICPPDYYCPPSVIMMQLNMYNNIVFDNSAMMGGEDIFIFEQGYNVTDLTFNLFNNDFSDIFSNQLLTVGSNIDEDPLFVDAEAGDFSLQPDSPCIDAGDPDAPDVPDTDIYGNPRVPPPDMGAVEFIEEAVKGGGCSIAGTPVESSLAVFLVVPVILIVRRFVNRYRR